LGRFFLLPFRGRRGFLFLARFRGRSFFFLVFSQRCRGGSTFLFVPFGFDFFPGDSPYVERLARGDRELQRHARRDPFAAAPSAHRNRREFFAARAFVLVGGLQAFRLAQRRGEDGGFLIGRTHGREEGADRFGGFARAFECHVGPGAGVHEHADFVFRLADVDELGVDRARANFFFGSAFGLAFATAVGASLCFAPCEDVSRDGRARA